MQQNWPTLSKDRTNPDAGLWDAQNGSDCSFYLEQEGMRDQNVSCGPLRWRQVEAVLMPAYLGVHQVSATDFTLARHNNKKTGQDPQAEMSSAFLEACDNLAFHRSKATSELGGIVTEISSWCRRRFLKKAGSYGISLYPISFSLPLTAEGTFPAGVYFATVGDQPLSRAGKVIFKDSIGLLSKGGSITQHTANVSLKASFPAVSTG